jgi:hypothetical protein
MGTGKGNALAAHPLARGRVLEQSRGFLGEAIQVHHL